MLDRCRRADSFFRPQTPTASSAISLREIFSAADGSEGVSDLGMADAPHEPALVLYLPDKPLSALVADASLDASPQARRHPRRPRRPLMRPRQTAAVSPLDPDSSSVTAAARRSGTPSPSCCTACSC